MVHYMPVEVEVEEMETTLEYHLLEKVVPEAAEMVEVIIVHLLECQILVEEVGVV